MAKQIHKVKLQTPEYSDCKKEDNSYDEDKLCEAIYQEYLAHGLSTEPVDKSHLNKYYREAYKIVQESIPEAPPFRKIVWVNSPLAGCYLYLIYKEFTARAKLNAHKIITHIDRSLMDVKFKDLLPKNKNLEPDFAACFRACSMGGWESYWVGHFTFGELINDNYPDGVKKRLAIMRELCKGHIWWPTPGYIIACERPNTISRDDQNRLHSTTGPALGYSDDFGFYYIDGIHVPRKVVMDPANITIEEIKAENNAAVRRIYIQQYGLRRFLKDTGAVKLDEATNQVLYQDVVENRKFIICSDGSTGAIYDIQVPNEVNTCKDAQDALYGSDSSNIVAES